MIACLERNYTNEVQFPVPDSIFWITTQCIKDQLLTQFDTEEEEECTDLHEFDDINGSNVLLTLQEYINKNTPNTTYENQSELMKIKVN